MKRLGDELRKLYGDNEQTTATQRAMIDDLFEVVAAWEDGLPIEEAVKFGFDASVRHKIIKKLIGGGDRERLPRFTRFLIALDEQQSALTDNPGFMTPHGWIDRRMIDEHGGIAGYDQTGRYTVTFPATIENGVVVWPDEFRRLQALAPRIKTHGQPRDEDQNKTVQTSEYLDQWLTQDDKEIT